MNTSSGNLPLQPSEAKKAKTIVSHVLWFGPWLVYGIIVAVSLSSPGLPSHFKLLSTIAVLAALWLSCRLFLATRRRSFKEVLVVSMLEAAIYLPIGLFIIFALALTSIPQQR